jgi:hypothetical protein
MLGRASSSPDPPPPTTLPRDECCRGLPGDALCIPCNADPLSLSANPHRKVPQAGHVIVTPLLLPRDECCRGLPGDALSVPCNAGPLSLSAYPQSFTSQTTDTMTPSSIHAQPQFPSTTSPTPLTTSCSISPDGPPYLFATEDTSCIFWKDVPSLPLVSLQRDNPMPAYTVLPRLLHILNVKGLLIHRCLVSSCRAVWSPDSPLPLNLPRDECCRGLPGDALCVPCNADPLSLSATLHKMVAQAGNETVLLLLMPRDECCRGLPGDALSILCNAGPLSLSAYPQISTSPTTDTAPPSSVHTQPHLFSTTSPTPLTTSFPISPDGLPYLNATKDASCISWNEVPSLHLVSQLNDYPMSACKVLPRMIHSLSFPPPTVSPMIPPPSLSTSPIGLPFLLHRCLAFPCRAVWSPVSPLPMNLPRDECCRGLPGDTLCVLCNADPLSLSATIHKTVEQAGNETILPLLLPGEECCRGLPGDALRINQNNLYLSCTCRLLGQK